jgi:hypothetical protein
VVPETQAPSFTHALIFGVAIVFIPIIATVFIISVLGMADHPLGIPSDPTVNIPSNGSCEDYANRTAAISAEWEKVGFPPMRPNLVTVNGSCKFGRAP